MKKVRGPSSSSTSEKGPGDKEREYFIMEVAPFEEFMARALLNYTFVVNIM